MPDTHRGPVTLAVTAPPLTRVTDPDVRADAARPDAARPGGCCADGCCAPTPNPAAPPIRSATWHRAARRARLLSWVSLVWMTGEGVLGLVAGLRGGAVSLVGWAVGSVIEGLAA